MAHFWRVGVAVGLINALSNNADEIANCCDCFSVANHNFIIIQMLIGNRIKLHFIHNFFHVLIEFLSFVSFHVFIDFSFLCLFICSTLAVPFPFTCQLCDLYFRFLPRFSLPSLSLSLIYPLCLLLHSHSPSNHNTTTPFLSYRSFCLFLLS